jgi:hypothetical protein
MNGAGWTDKKDRQELYAHTTIALCTLQVQQQYTRTTETLAKARVPVLLAGTQDPRTLVVTGLANEMDRNGQRNGQEWTETGPGGPVFLAETPRWGQWSGDDIGVTT